MDRTPWPSVASEASRSVPPKVGIVVANFNTRLLISQLVFSLYRLLGRTEFDHVVVVDNASTDGSVEVLEALQTAGLISLVRNASQQYHGPALTQGVSWLARRQQALSPEARLDYVWALDSDVVVLRPDTARDALNELRASNAAAVGPPIDEPMYNRLLLNNGALLHPFSLILDPALLWQPSIPPFVEDGTPAAALQVGADAQGLVLTGFPFVEDGYLIHLGRGTLRQIAELGDSANRYYDWARAHREPHFSGEARAADAYGAFCELFEAEVGELSSETLVAACRREALLTPSRTHERPGPAIP